MHGGRHLCAFLPVLRGLSHRKAVSTLLLRADLQQLPVKYNGDLYAWLSSGITYGERRLGTIFPLLGGLSHRADLQHRLFRQNMKNFKISRLTPDFRKLQTLTLNPPIYV